MCRKYWKYSDRYQPCPWDGEQPEPWVRKARVVHVLLISLPRNWESAKRSALSMIWQHSHWSLRQLPLGMHRVPSPMLPQHEKKTQKTNNNNNKECWIVFLSTGILVYQHSDFACTLSHLFLAKNTDKQASVRRWKKNIFFPTCLFLSFCFCIYICI